MANISQDIPKWIAWPHEKEPSPDLCQQSREEMYKALSHWHNHVKYVINIMLAAPVVILTIMRAWPNPKADSRLCLIAGGILVFIPWIAYWAKKLVKMYYKVYVSALIFATRTHTRLNRLPAHPWFKRTVEQAKTAADEKGAESCLDFLEIRAEDPEDTLVHYRWIIDGLSIINLIAGIIFLYLGREGLFRIARFFLEL